MACTAGEGIGPGDNFCTLFDVLYEQALYCWVAPTEEVYNGNNTGYVTEVDEQLSNTHPTSFNSAWIAVAIIDGADTSKFYSIECNSASGAVLELYDRLIVADNNTLAGVTLAGASKRVQGQGTNKITFKLDDGTDPLIHTTVSLLRVFNPSDGGGVFTLTSSEVPPPDLTSNIIDSAISNSAPALHLTVKPVIADSANIVSAVNTFLDQNVFVSEMLLYKNHIYILAKEILSDGLLHLDQANSLHFKIINIINKYVSKDIQKNSMLAIEDIAVVLSLADTLNRYFPLNIQEANNLHDEIVENVNSYIKIINSMLFDDVMSDERYIRFSISDTMTVNEQTNISAILLNTIAENATLFGSLNFDGTEYFAYTYNTQSGGVTEYQNYHFNSFSWPLAAADDGIYELTGDTDDGDNIAASIRTGLMDFGTSLQKQVPYAYLGIAESGRTLLKVITVTQGIKKEVWYEVNPTNTTIDTVRAQLGRGMKGRYWQFELSNIEGEDFALESMELLPLILKRRV